jgi:uncharacterized cupredoxin-like copper-binding protein
MADGDDDAKRDRLGLGVALGFVAAGLSILALIVAAAALAVAIHNNDKTGSSAASPSNPTTIPVTLQDYKVGLESTTISPTQATLQISNAGAVAHELLVFESALPPTQFPLSPDGSVNEEGPGITKISDGENLDPGTQQTRALDLTKPGTYVFMCNLPGHYAQGMYTTVTVQ